MAIINFPILYIPDPDKNNTLFNGQIYVGGPGQDAANIPTNQKQLRVVDDNNVLIDVAQPFLLSAGGVPVYQPTGQPVRLDVDGDFSLLILDKNGQQKYYIRNVYSGTPVLIEDLPQYVSAEFATVDDMIAGSSINFGAVDFADYDGRVVGVTINNETSKKGGASYIIKTKDQAILDGDIIDGYANHYVGAESDYVAILEDEPNMANMGATFDGDQFEYFSALAEKTGVIKSDQSFELSQQYTATADLIIRGDYSITCAANIDCVIRSDANLLWEGVTPEVADGFITTYAFVYSTVKLPTFRDFEIGDMQGGDFFESSGSFGVSDVLTLSGDFCAENVRLREGVTSDWLFKVVGGSDWSLSGSNAPTASFKNCHLRGGNYYYTAKGFRLVEVDGCEFEHDKYREYLHDWYSQDAGLVGWGANNPANVTIDGGRVTTTAGSNGIISDSGDTLTAGEIYRLSISLDFDSGTTFRIYENSSSGALIASGLEAGVHNIEFTPVTNCRIYIRFDVASVANFEMVQALRDPSTDAKGSATFDTYTHKVTNSVFRGGERGPTAGIDTLNIDFSNNQIFDAWNRAIALDTERFSPPSWDSAYPKSRASVTDNEAYNCGRLIYSTCRHALVADNVGDNCAISGSFTGTPGAMRFNSDDWGFDDFSNIYVHDNVLVGCGSNPAISCDPDHRIVQYDNLHDSDSEYPIQSLKGVYRYPPSALEPKTASFTLDPSMPFVYVEYATTGTFLEISVPNDDNLIALGYEYTIVFVGVVGDVRLKAQSGDGTINGGTLAVVPTSTKICKVVNTNSACDHLGVFLT